MTIVGALVLFRKKITQQINAAMGNYFTIDELCYSDTARAKGISNTPNASERANLQKLINTVLNPIREKYGKPIRVNSGFRSLALNTAIGGAKNSQHMTGCAADLSPTSGGSLAAIFRAAVACNNYDQLIIEKSGNSTWVHVSYSPIPRRQMLSFNNGTYTAININTYENYLA